MRYIETKKELDTIRSENEMIFRMAISHLMDVGIRNLDDESVKETCNVIMEFDDSRSLMTNEYQCQIIRTAAKIAKFNHIHLLAYIQKEMNYDVEYME